MRWNRESEKAQTQDTWLVQLVQATTTRQPPALTILYVYFHLINSKFSLFQHEARVPSI